MRSLYHLMTVAETAAALKYSLPWVRILADTGRLPCYRTKLGRLFSPEDVEAYKAERARRRGEAA